MHDTLYVFQALDQAKQTRLTHKEPLFMCHRPPWAHGLAAPLIHPVFGQFLLDAKDSSLVQRRDTSFAIELCDASLVTYSSEETRQNKIVSGRCIYTV